MIDVIINGAKGKMGRLIKTVIETDYKERARIVQLRDFDTQEPAPKADIVIDFSLPEGAKKAYPANGQTFPTESVPIAK